MIVLHTEPTGPDAPASKAEVETCRPSGNVAKTHPGVGMPTSIYLQMFGDLCFQAFGEPAYQVGSSISKPVWRDVDVRVMLSKEKYAAMGLGDPERTHENERWCAFCMAFSALGRQMTGLPIDFQLQETEWANAFYPDHVDHPRNALCLLGVRRGNRSREIEAELRAERRQPMDKAVRECWALVSDSSPPDDMLVETKIESVNMGDWALCRRKRCRGQWLDEDGKTVSSKMIPTHWHPI